MVDPSDQEIQISILPEFGPQTASLSALENVLPATPRAGKLSHSLTTAAECILGAAPKEGGWLKLLGSYLSQQYLSREPDQQFCLSFEIAGVPVWQEDLVCSFAWFESQRTNCTGLVPVLPHPGVKLIHRPTYCWVYTQSHPCRKPDRESRKLSSLSCNHLWAVNQPSNLIQLFPASSSPSISELWAVVLYKNSPLEQPPLAQRC